MDARYRYSPARVVVALLLAAGLGGCAVYGPPYAAAYDPYYSGYAYPAYGYPAYYGPPISLDLGFGFYGGHRHHHRGYHGWRSDRGWSGHGGGHYRGGGWRSGRGRR